MFQYSIAEWRTEKEMKNWIIFLLGLFLTCPWPSNVFPQTNWIQTALDTGRVYHIATNSQGDIFADWYFSANFFLRSTNQGNDWSTLDISPNASIQCLFFDSKGWLFTSTVGIDSTQSGLYWSKDNGNSWQKRSSIWPDGMTTREYGSEYLAASDDYHYYGILRSTDTCRTWERISPTENGHSYTDIAITHQGTILVPRIVNKHGAILRSTNGGSTWSVQNDLGDRIYTRKIYVLPGGEVFAVGNRGIMRSLDDGITWDGVNNGIPFPSMFNMEALAMDSSGVLYAGADIGGGSLYRSMDTGWTWSSWTEGLRDSPVLSLVVDRAGYVFAGTIHGVFRTSGPVTGVTNTQTVLPSAYTLYQNFPNPFNPTTEIKFEIPVSGFVSLKICNLLGQVVETLAADSKSPGSYSISWDGRGFSSGMYFYTLRAGDVVVTKKLLLIR